MRRTLLTLVALAALSLPLPAQDAPRANVKLIGHRGFTRDAVENSMSALEAAVQLGLAGSEIDLRTTRDGHVVLMHDETVDRTTTGSGAVEAMSYREVTALRLERPDGRVVDERVPDLDAVVAFLERHPRFEVAFDAKEVDVQAVGRRVLDAHVQDRVTFFIADPQDVDHAEAIKRVDPRLRISVNLLTWWKIEGLPTFVRRSLHADALFASEYFFPRRFDEAKAAGAEVQVFIPGTANLIERFTRAVEMGADAVSSDRPDLLVPLVRRSTN